LGANVDPVSRLITYLLLLVFLNSLNVKFKKSKKFLIDATFTETTAPVYSSMKGAADPLAQNALPFSICFFTGKQRLLCYFLLFLDINTTWQYGDAVQAGCSSVF